MVGYKNHIHDDIQHAERGQERLLMEVVYATDVNAANIHNWSGLSWYYRKMLENAGWDVTPMDKSNMRHPLLLKLKAVFLHKILPKQYAPRFDNGVSKYYADCINKAVAPGSLVLSPNTVVLAYLKKNLKKVLYADATFHSLLHLYPKYRELAPQCLRDGEEIDRRAIADRLIYTSQWAADSAIQHYGASPEKVFVVPFGANLDVLPTFEEVKASIKSRMHRKHLDLLFLGLDWVRKGGNYALQVVNRLNEGGFPATLHIVGAVNLPATIDKRHIINHTYISKATPEGQQQLAALLSESHFLVLPTLADCTPVACSEAAAYGVPCLTSDVGGLTSIVKNDVNGRTFSMEKFLDEAVAYITGIMTSEEVYSELCRSSYHTYESELNWNTVGKRITQIMQGI
jgi:glycosyltransferase involved in cell wall biosynthesis